MSSTPPAEAHEKETGLAAVAQTLARFTEKWFPDAFVFAAFGTVLVAILVLLNGGSPVQTVKTFGDGFWDLTAFTLQMAMVVVTGYVVATSPPATRLIEALAHMPKTPRGAIAWVAFIALVVSLLNWGLSLIMGGLLARAVARRKELQVDYRALGAASLMGLGAVWALGLSSSAAQLQATKTSIPAALLPITGVLDFGKTIFTWQSMVSAVVLIALTVVVAYASSPKGAAVRTAEDMGIDTTDEVAEPEPRSRPAEWFEYNAILPIGLGILTLGWVIYQFSTKPVVTVLSNLNGYLMVFMILGLCLHGTPRRFLMAVNNAIPAAAGILIQFPLYAAMAAMLTKVKGFEGHTVADRLATIFTTFGHGGGFAIALAVYTAFLGLLVPSGGGKWLVEAPYVMKAANDLEYNLGWTVQIYNMAEALPNLINPFFMLPLLAILKLRARDLVGFTFLQFLIHTPVVLLLVWLLGATFTYQPPIVP
ncbi:TIGR00366 family protein [Mariniluteicoccus endophyticus]